MDGISNPPILGVACNGSINYVASPGLVIDSGGALTLTSGATKLTVTSGMVSGQSYTITSKYGGDEKACGGAPDKVFQSATQ
jgi:adhesin HecA-like repeat protein